MSELEKIRAKYHNWNLIEIKLSDIKKSIEWVTGTIIGNVMYWEEAFGQKLMSLIKTHNGFIKFLNKGVIISKDADKGEGYCRYYPFEFIDEGLVISVVITDPDDNQLKTLGKILIAPTMTKDGFNIKVYQKEAFNEDLYNRHYSDMVRDRRVIGRSNYFEHILNVQSLIVTCVNAYLVLHEKEILVSRITQTRTMTPSEKKGHGNKKINPLYRYEVEIPEDYKPRRFDVNYIESEWDRSGHRASRWVNVENAELIAERCGGEILWDSQTVEGKVKVLRPIAPQKVHRRIGTPTMEEQPKTYSTT